MLQRRVLPVLVGLVLTLSASVGVAQAAADNPASTPGWRPVAEIGPADGETYEFALVATSAKDAWSTWTVCGPCGGTGGYMRANWLEHWTGHVWRHVSVPSSVGRIIGVANGIATTSADDLWLLTIGRAAHWNGKRWRIMKIPSWVVRHNLEGNIGLALADFGPTNLWAFTTGIYSAKPVVPYAARYNGHRWRKVRLPGVPGQVSVVGPDDIWAVGINSRNGRQFLMHWGGKSWSTMALPKPRQVPAHLTAHIDDLTALGDSDVWMQQDLINAQLDSRTELFLHWNGRSWQTVHYPWPDSGVEFMASDGHGGLWLADVGSGPSGLRYLAHDSAGTWTRRLVPAPRGTGVIQLTSLTNVPGTWQMWATGQVFPLDADMYGAGEIWKYGS
jgi:hypothetical protein